MLFNHLKLEEHEFWRVFFNIGDVGSAIVIVFLLLSTFSLIMAILYGNSCTECCTYWSIPWLSPYDFWSCESDLSDLNILSSGFFLCMMRKSTSSSFSYGIYLRVGLSLILSIAIFFLMARLAWKSSLGHSFLKCGTPWLCRCPVFFPWIFFPKIDVSFIFKGRVLDIKWLITSFK